MRTLRTPVKFIVHTLQDVNNALAHGRFFFMDIALYQADETPLHTPKPKTPEQAIAMAQEYLQECLPPAIKPSEGSGFYLSKGHLKDAAFDLHRINPVSPALRLMAALLLWARLGAILSVRLGVVDGSGGGLLAGRATSPVE